MINNERGIVEGFGINDVLGGRLNQKEVFKMALNPIWKLAPYFVVKWLGKKYCERVPHQGLVVEVFEKEGIAILEDVKPHQGLFAEVIDEDDIWKNYTR